MHADEDDLHLSYISTILQFKDTLVRDDRENESLNTFEHYVDTQQSLAQWVIISPNYISLFN